MTQTDPHDPTLSTACPFCEIVAGRRLQEVVYATDAVVAFLCEPPATWGHVLVVPRQHRADIWEISPEEAASVILAARLLADVVRSDLGAVGVNLRQNNGSKAGQDVFHFHLHLVPRYPDDTLLPGCVWDMPPWEPPTGGDEERRRVAETIRRGVETRADTSGSLKSLIAFLQGAPDFGDLELHRDRDAPARGTTASDDLDESSTRSGW